MREIKHAALSMGQILNSKNDWNTLKNPYSIWSHGMYIDNQEKRQKNKETNSDVRC